MNLSSAVPVRDGATESGSHNSGVRREAEGAAGEGW